MVLLPDDSDEYIDSPESDDDQAGDVGATDDDDVDQGRPNRWQGPPSTWEGMNREEIDTIAAMHEIRNSDLSVHLYNAFALKVRHKRPLDNNLPVPGQVRTCFYLFCPA